MPAIYQNFSKGLVQTSLGNVNPRATSLTEEYTLGTELIKKDQKWRYCKNGAGVLAPGKLVQSSLLIAAHHDMAPADTAAGSKTVSVTLGGGAAATANQYAGGFLQIDDGAGEGFMYRVASHPAADAGAALVVTLEEGLQVAVAAATNVTLVANPWSGALVGATGLSAHVIGVSTSSVAAGSYFWAQVGGPCSVLSDGVCTVGVGVVRSNATAGAVEASAAETDTQHQVGICMGASETGEYAAVHLTIE